LDENEACARWDFVRGEFVERLNEFIKARVHPEGLGSKNPPVVPYELVKEFRNLVGEANCFSVWQRPGALVEVPSTMAHQVTNLKPNIKIAWDYVDAAYLLRGVRAQHLISKNVGGAAADDYVSLYPLLQMFLKKLITFHSPSM
jgi:hypothetical protein